MSSSIDLMSGMSKHFQLHKYFFTFRSLCTFIKVSNTSNKNFDTKERYKKHGNKHLFYKTLFEKFLAVKYVEKLNIY